MQVLPGKDPEMRAYGLRVDLECNDECFCKRQKEKTRAKGHVDMEVNTGAMRPQAKKYQGLRRAPRSWERSMESLPELPAGTHPRGALVSDFWPPERWKEAFPLF